ncbi:MAG: hypothetical protein HYV14_06040 [Elusimicrobia bacterium]|nr:hypothetical protein [Elusimicrobiota bacterium]
MTPLMNDRQEPREKESCTLCRWMEMLPQPYGAVEYFCVSRQETILSSALGKRRCPKFEA